MRVAVQPAAAAALIQTSCQCAAHTTKDGKVVTTRTRISNSVRESNSRKRTLAILFLFVFDLILFPALLHIFVSSVGQNTRTRFGGYHLFFSKACVTFLLIESATGLWSLSLVLRKSLY